MSFRLSKRVATARNCLRAVADWSFLSNHERVLPSIVHDAGARLRDIAAGLGITERSAPHGDEAERIMDVIAVAAIAPQ